MSIQRCGVIASRQRTNFPNISCLYCSVNMIKESLSAKNCGEADMLITFCFVFLCCVFSLLVIHTCLLSLFTPLYLRPDMTLFHQTQPPKTTRELNENSDIRRRMSTERFCLFSKTSDTRLQAPVVLLGGSASALQLSALKFHSNEQSRGNCHTHIVELAADYGTNRKEGEKPQRGHRLCHSHWLRSLSSLCPLSLCRSMEAVVSANSLSHWPTHICTSEDSFPQDKQYTLNALIVGRIFLAMDGCTVNGTLLDDANNNYIITTCVGKCRSANVQYVCRGVVCKIGSFST